MIIKLQTKEIIPRDDVPTASSRVPQINVSLLLELSKLHNLIPTTHHIKNIVLSVTAHLPQNELESLRHRFTHRRRNSIVKEANGDVELLFDFEDTNIHVILHSHQHGQLHMV